MSGASEIRRIEAILRKRLAAGGQKNRLDRGNAMREMALDIHQALVNAAESGTSSGAVSEAIRALEGEADDEL